MATESRQMDNQTQPNERKLYLRQVVSAIERFKNAVQTRRQQDAKILAATWRAAMIDALDYWGSRYRPIAGTKYKATATRAGDRMNVTARVFAWTQFNVRFRG